MKEKQSHSHFAKLAGLCVALLFSCAQNLTPAEAAPEVTIDEQTLLTEVKPQLIQAFSSGLVLDFDTLDLRIPSTTTRGENVFSLPSAKAQIQLEKASLHSLSLSLDAPLNYNGVDRELSLTLHDDNLYFSLSADRDNNASYDLKYCSSLAPYDAGGVDETTRGISYYEYGDLDYVVAEVLTVCGVNEIDLELSNEGLTLDWDAIMESMDTIVSYDASRFLWELPINDKIFRLGLVHDEEGVLSGIELPLKESSSQGYASINENFELRIDAKILDGVNLSWAPRYPTSEYVPLKDSLALFRQIAKFVKRRTFGIEAAFTLSHTEDAVEGDDDHFAKEAVSEDAYLNLFAAADFSSTFFGGLHAEIALGQTGGQEKDILLHSEDGSEENNPNIYLNVNDILKVKTSVDVCDALIQSLSDALGDESIQNDEIMKLLSSLLSTANGISEAIKAVQNSSFYQNIDKKHFEDILQTIVDIKTDANHIELTVDLSAASLLGTITVMLNGTADNMSLGKVILDHVGLKSTNETKTSFVIDGELDITPYQTVEFDPTGYVEMTHLPHWTEEINAIAERDQLQVQLDGYALKQGTKSKVSSTTANAYVYDPVQKKGRTEQGLAFHGSLAFDLANRLGTGAMTFIDLKEDYVNDHNLKIDVTGEAGENDTDANDMAGSGNQNAMFFEYNSKNVTAVSGSDAFSAESRRDPDSNHAPLTGRFSVHSLNGIIDVIMELTDSTDPRFERLTNLVSSLATESLLSKLLAGEYFELLSSKILSSAEISDNHATFVVSPGVIQKNTGLTLKIGYGNDHMPLTIEVWLVLEGEENNTEVYAKITLGETSFDSFPFQFSNHTQSNYKDYSTIKSLLEFALGTITLGVTDSSSVTTYHIGGTIDLKILFSTYTVNLDLFLYMNGTDIKIMGALFVPKIAPVVTVVNDNTYLNFYYESNGSDTAGDLYLRRITLDEGGSLSNGSAETTHRRVKGGDFADNLLEWLLNYMLNMGSVVTGNLGSDSASKALHGESIIRGWSVAGSLSNPEWTIVIGMKELVGLSINIFEDMTVTIKGKTATYNANGKSYSKKSLYSLNGSLNLKLLGIEAASATINLSIKNIASSGAYSDGWGSSSHKATIYQKTNSSKGGLFNAFTHYSLVSGTAIPSSAFVDATYGRNSSNGNFKNCPFYRTPDTLA